MRKRFLHLFLILTMIVFTVSCAKDISFTFNGGEPLHIEKHPKIENGNSSGNLSNGIGSPKASEKEIDAEEVVIDEAQENVKEIPESESTEVEESTSSETETETPEETGDQNSSQNDSLIASNPVLDIYLKHLSEYKVEELTNEAEVEAPEEPTLEEKEPISFDSNILDIYLKHLKEYKVEEIADESPVEFEVLEPPKKIEEPLVYDNSIFDIYLNRLKDFRYQVEEPPIKGPGIFDVYLKRLSTYKYEIKEEVRVPSPPTILLVERYLLADEGDGTFNFVSNSYSENELRSKGNLSASVKYVVEIKPRIASVWRIYLEALSKFTYPKYSLSDSLDIFLKRLSTFSYPETEEETSVQEEIQEEVSLEEEPLIEETVEEEKSEEKIKVSFSSHLYVNTAFLYNFPNLSLTWDIGAKFDIVETSFYLKGDYFFRPLGSNSYNLASSELGTEFGLSLKFKLYQLKRFSINLGVEIGYYQQWLMLFSDLASNTYHLTNNGLMLRPSISFGFNIVGWWDIELGFFYQTPVYPYYDGFQGWGFYLMLL